MTAWQPSTGVVDLRTGWVIGFSGMRTLPAYVDWLIDQPISVAPLQRVPEQARAAAVEAMRGQPREVVRDAAHGAVRDAIFLVELVLKLNVPAEETIQLLGLRPDLARPAQHESHCTVGSPGAGRW